MGGDVAAGKNLFEMLRELRVNRHHVFKVSMRRAVLDHQDLTVAFDDLGFDLADLFIHQNFMGEMAVENLLANLRDTLGAKRICRARPSQWRLRLLVGLEQRLVGPLRRWRRVGLDAIQAVEHNPGSPGGNGDCFFHVLDRLAHLSSWFLAFSYYPFFRLGY